MPAPKSFHPIAKEELSNVFSMMVHKVGNVVINSTDNILISALVGIVYAGLYSNYILIINIRKNTYC